MLNYSKKILVPCANQIELDLKRTFPDDAKCMEEAFLSKLRNVLTCFSIRNSSIGYCQGMNFIAGKLLRVIDNEEQVFWIFIQIIEHILPLNYYSELTGVIIDTTLTETILRVYFPELYFFFTKNNFKLTLSNFIHKWLVCLFTSTFQKEVAYTILDFFFIDGSLVLIKTCLCVFAALKDDLIKNNDFESLYGILNDCPQKMNNPNIVIFFLESKRISFDKHLLKQFRSKLRVPIYNGLIKKKLISNKTSKYEKKKVLKKKGVTCDPNWPSCIYAVDAHEVLDFLVLKESRLNFIIDDYYYVKNKQYPDETYDLIDEFNNIEDKEVLCERHAHFCDDKKLVDSSKNFLEAPQSSFFEDNSDCSQVDLKIYGDLEEDKDVDNVVQTIIADLSSRDKPIKDSDYTVLINSSLYYPKNYNFHTLE